MKFGIPVNENPPLGYEMRESRRLAFPPCSVSRTNFALPDLTREKKSDRPAADRKERATTIL